MFICTLFVSGCDLAQPQNKGQEQPAAPPAEPPPAEVPVPPQEDAPAQEGTTEMVRAEAGVGVRGQSLSPGTGNNPMEIITVPVRTYFTVQQRLDFQRVDAAMNYFRGEHGRLPNSHNEFMEKIIQANHLQLPQLRPNEKYIYDPVAGELKVERPR